MTTIISVHGTFAHVGEAPPDAPHDETLVPWWREDSAFAKLLGELGKEPDESIQFESFKWSGANSERARRLAGCVLLEKLRKLEASGEPYAIVAHSHGGSVVSWALLESVRRNVKLDHLQKWVTVGTPFVALRKERFLFTRLPILLKAVFVASLMLLFMLLFYVAADLASGGEIFKSRFQAWRFGTSAVLTTLPFAVFYLVARFWDGRELFFYRRRVIKRARERFAPRWVGLCHEDDEAVRGLSSLKFVKVPIFDREFAVPAISLLSAFLLPLGYLYVVNSPPTMLALTSFLQTRIYNVAGYEKVALRFRTAEEELRTLGRNIWRLRRKLRDAETPNASATQADRAELDRLVKHRSELRRDLKLVYQDPSFAELQRASRFVRRFLRKNGEPCAGNTLCGGGKDAALNSRLLFYLVTDEASSLLVDEDVRWSSYGFLMRNVVLLVLVPVAFGIAAICLVLVIQVAGRFTSSRVSRYLDSLTWTEVRRSALGNDTESEVALTASPTPAWIGTPPRYLPAELRDEITQHSNVAMTQSLSKIRNAISELAFTDGHQSEAATSVLGFLNWQELIHTSYFEVPKFRAFVAHILTDGNPAARTEALSGYLEDGVAQQWMAALMEPMPVAATARGQA